MFSCQLTGGILKLREVGDLSKVTQVASVIQSQVCLELSGHGVFPGYGAAVNQNVQPSPCETLTPFQTASLTASLPPLKGARDSLGAP